MKRYIQIILCSLLAIFAVTSSLLAQDLSASAQLQPEINIANGSFEGPATKGSKSGAGPRKWRDCGKIDESSPDVHHADSLFFEVGMAASDGKTFLGMVVRENVTWEAIGQRLRTPLRKGKCYTFSIDLARSKRYMSPTKYSDLTVNYEKAAVLRIWGANSFCMKMELLDETDAVENHDWRTYNLRLEPSRNYSFILLEVFYKTPVFTEYNGNMLLDNASNLIPVPCDEAPKPPMEAPKEELLVSTGPINTSPSKPKSKPNEVGKPKLETKPAKANGKPVKKKKEYVKELDQKLVVGQEITLKKLNFEADSANFNPQYFPIVDDVFSFLEENKNVVIEVGGHTNNRCEDNFCNKLSRDRAESVANYLIRKGIDVRRVKFKGYGKTSPKYPNNTPTNRRRNQRVEVKILAVN